MLGVPALLIVHPPIFLIPKMPLVSSSFWSWLQCYFFSYASIVFFFTFSLCCWFVLIFHCWESCRLGRGESVTGRWWLLLKKLDASNGLFCAKTYPVFWCWILGAYGTYYLWSTDIQPLAVSRVRVSVQHLHDTCITFNILDITGVYVSVSVLCPVLVLVSVSVLHSLLWWMHYFFFWFFWLRGSWIPVCACELTECIPNLKKMDVPLVIFFNISWMKNILFFIYTSEFGVFVEILTNNT